jgi:hypothetical protein
LHERLDRLFSDKRIALRVASKPAPSLNDCPVLQKERRGGQPEKRYVNTMKWVRNQALGEVISQNSTMKKFLHFLEGRGILHNF